MLLLFGFAALDPAKAAPHNRQPVRAEVTVDVSDGYARLVFVLGDDVEASVHGSGNVLIISFDQPVIMAVEHLTAQASQYIVAARRDPDGRAIRLGLARKVSVSSIAAADKFFVDLLPDTWSGPPPNLPHEVVEELARRAREVEHLQRLAHQAEQKKKALPARVHVGSQPTFTRYVFDIPEHTSVSADRAKERLTLSFDAPLTFDLTDAEVALPANVASINAETEQDATLVRFSFMAPVDLRTFRDGKSYVVDIVKDEAAAPAREKAGGNTLPMTNMEAMPPANAAGEDIAMAPAAAAPQAPAAENPAVVPPPAPIAAPNPPQPLPEPAAAAEPAAERPTPKPRDGKPAAETQPSAAAEVKAPTEAKASAEAKPAAEANPSAESKTAAEAKALAEVKAAEAKAAEAIASAEAKIAAEAKASAETKAAEAKAAEPRRQKPRRQKQKARLRRNRLRHRRLPRSRRLHRPRPHPHVLR